MLTDEKSSRKERGQPWQSVAYSPDGRHIISGSYDTTIRIWDADTGASVGRPLKRRTKFVHSVVYSPDGRHIISGSEYRTIRIWDAETGGAVGQPLKGHASCTCVVHASPTLPMGGTSSLDLMTGRFESGMPRLTPQLVSL